MVTWVRLKDSQQTEAFSDNNWSSRNINSRIGRRCIYGQLRGPFASPDRDEHTVLTKTPPVV